MALKYYFAEFKEVLSWLSMGLRSCSISYFSIRLQLLHSDISVIMMQDGGIAALSFGTISNCG
jgi:hypothetical protein